MTEPVWSMVEYRGRDGLVRLEADWRRIYNSMPERAGCHAFEAHLSFLDHLMESPDELRCLALRDGQRTRAICLLEAKTDRVLGFPLRVWRAPLPSHMPWGDVLCPEDEARRTLMPVLLEHLRRASGGRCLLLLGPLPEGSIVWTGLQQLRPDDYCVVPADSAHIIDCTRSFDELMSRLTRKARGSLRRRQRKLDALDDVRFVTTRCPSDLANEFETFLDVEACGWKGEGGSRGAVRCHADQPAFYRDLLKVSGPSDHCEIDSLYADGKCIASQLWIRTGSEYAGLKMGYDEDYARLGPSNLLLWHVLRRCCLDEGVHRVNFVSDSPWQLVWAPDSIPLRRAYIALGRWSGRPLTALLRLRFGPGRRLGRRLRRERKRLEGRRAARIATQLVSMVRVARPSPGESNHLSSASNENRAVHS
jgi:hypothetical protein